MPELDHRSLNELMRTVRARTIRASETIGKTDDPDIVDCEFRYVRPFWEFFTHRRRVNSARVWKRLGEEAFPGADEPLMVRNPLVWLPRSPSLADVPKHPSPLGRRRLYALLGGLDGAVFNFVGLMGRMRHTLGWTDDDSFDVRTTEEEGEEYRLLYRILSRETPAGRTCRIITCQFEVPSGERLKLERDYSESKPRISLRLAGSGRAGLGFDGRLAELKAGRGGDLRVGSP